MLNKITNLIFEALHLKQVKHEWYRLAWVNTPDSIAEHSLSAAQIAYILAKLEWADANKCACILVWHDIAETRMGDLHKIASRYIENKSKIEEKIVKEQFKWTNIWEEIMLDFKKYKNWSSLEWLIAKDADLLEQAFQAKIYLENWHHKAQDWINNVWKALKTKSAKSLFLKIKDTSFTDWWETSKLKKLN